MREILNEIKLNEAEKNSNLKKPRIYIFNQPNVKFLGSHESYRVLKFK
jgi:hypothetical protein